MIPYLKKYFIKYPYFLLLVVGSFYLLFWSPVQVYAQLLPSPDTTDKKSQANEPAWPSDSLGRRTPRGTVRGFIQAIAQKNYVRAAYYIRIDSTVQNNQNGVVLARALEGLLNKNGNIYPYSWISDDPGGMNDDNLGPTLDRVGEATINNESFDLVLESIQGPDGGPIWLFSSETIQRIPPDIVGENLVPLVNKVSPEVLEEYNWMGVPIAHWLAVLLLVVVVYLLAWGIIKLILFLLPSIWHKSRQEPIAGIIRAFSLPIQICLALWFFILGSQQVGISIVLRQRFSTLTLIVGLIALLLLLWQLIETIANTFQQRMVLRGHQAGVSAVLFLRRAAKIAIVLLGIILILDSFGFDVTTGLAALGIGGIALALGVQKTVENLVGSVALIADQPVRVGDFCKAGDIIGTIEQIGMRSTRIRTLNRTIVTIPNSEFSTLKIENYAHRDRFWFHPIFSLRFETTPEQIRFLLVELRSILYAHPHVDPNPARIRFIEIGADALKLEVFAYINAKDYDQFLEVQEDLFLRMMDVVEASGTGFAYPSQTLYIARDKGLSEEKAAEAEERVRKWREKGDLPIPNFSTERIESLRNSIPYPPEGSSIRTDNNGI
ncbi:mechanosensitive ion channel family protein [Telluribacter sp. SYSU D00476]|uniref:mechanosensitive ion channel family protein n=1 Tax=Telluribacter sp. SYSU D00476 TaxID=2811430 RepID=UPI001FF47D74|nr:mechanosensitive ion channel family protein [Telluribacter sp. SYSU D00476]